MTPEEIMAEALRKHVIGDGESIPVIGNTAESFMDEADAVTAALSAAGYVIVPREPTEAQAKAAAAEVPLANVSVFGWMAGYRAMISAVTKE